MLIFQGQYLQVRRWAVEGDTLRAVCITYTQKNIFRTRANTLVATVPKRLAAVLKSGCIAEDCNGVSRKLDPVLTQNQTVSWAARSATHLQF